MTEKINIIFTGVEFTSGTEITNPIGVTFSSSGRLLFLDGFTIENFELKSKFGFDHENDELGLTFEIAPTWGQTRVDAQNAIWDRSILRNNEEEVNPYTNGSKLDTEIGYGFSIASNSGFLKIYGGYEFENNMLDESTFGTEVSLGSNFSINFERIREFEIEKISPAKLQMRGNLKW